MTAVLVVNTGGVTLELTVVGDDEKTVAADLIDPWDGEDVEPLGRIVEEAGGIAAVGHRIVHGGRHTEPVVLDAGIVEELQEAADRAPAHQTRALTAIAAARRRLPDVPHVACFDTAFHRTMPPAASTYALPAAWRERWPLDRVGFHGLSHEHVAAAAGAIAGDRPAERIVSCHLGSGASLCAIAAGASIDTTMGMTPLDGLVMVARSGSVDPGLLLWLLRHTELTTDDLARDLNGSSGLRGIAGGTGDMRDVLAGAASGHEPSRLAFDVYIHRLRREIGAMTASLGGLDVLAFTGGVGQHLPAVRAAAVEGLAHLGLAIDSGRNEEALDDADITAAGARAACVVLATGEHLTVARHTRAVVARLSG